MSIMFMKESMYNEFYDMIEQIRSKNNFKKLKDLHCLLSCMKAYVTEDTLQHLKTIRELCGAQGFIRTSYLPELIDLTSPYVTLEGDNYVMYQQTAKIIVKAVADVARGKKATGHLEYLNDIAGFGKQTLHKFDPTDRQQLLDMLKANALYHVSRAMLFLRDDKDSFETKWNQVYQNDVVKLAQAHAAYLVCLEFARNVQTAAVSANLRTHLDRLCSVHIATTILKYADGAVLSKFAKAKHLAMVEEYMYNQIALFRPQLLNVLEACGLPESSMHSIIGSRNGRLYETLFETAAHSTLNNKTSLDCSFKYLKPLSQRLLAKM